MRVLLAGWFSFEQMGATAGDLLVRDRVAAWLEEAGCPYDVALAPPFGETVRWESANPGDYTHLIFACGPFGNGPPVDRMLARFTSCTLIGLNLSMLEDLDAWNPFDLLWERNSSETARADLSFGAPVSSVPVVGIVQVEPQKEYGERSRHALANETIEQLRASQPMAAVPVDTRLDENRTGLRTPEEIVTLIGRMDAVITTRLHGMVLALRQGVPALALDPIAGGAKISRQAETIGWPACLPPDNFTADAVRDQWRFCLSEEAREAARDARERATEQVELVRREFVTAIRGQAGELQGDPPPTEATFEDPETDRRRSQV